MNRASMTKFQGVKTMDQIRAQCKEQGLKLDTKHRRKGFDFIVVEGGGARVLFCTFNGWFFGRTPDGVKFDSNFTTHEGKPWFQALLRFFYVEEGSAV